MKIKLLVFSLLFSVVFTTQKVNAQLLQWNTFGNAGTETTEPSVANNGNISAANLTMGAGVNPIANGNRFGGNNWYASDGSLAQAITGNDYIQFIVTPNVGFSFTPTSFVFTWDKSGTTGPENVALRSSVDGFSSNLGTVTGVVAGAFTGNTITISGLTNITTATTFRIYGYGATATTGTGGFDINSDVVNVQLNGTTAPTAASPEINIQGNSTDIASGDPSPSLTDHTDFGSVNTASGTLVRTFTIQNTGTASLSLTGANPYVVISGTNASDFTVTATPSNSIGASGSTTFQVTFNPSADGVRTATISIANNDSNENPYTFAIQGNGISAPVITSGLTAAGAQGSAFTYNIIATNTPTSYNATGLPAGLSINTTTGVISGTPSVSGTFNVTITATNGIGSDSETLVVTIASGPCLSENFASNALPSSWIQTSVTFASARAEYNATTGQLTTIAVSNPASLTFSLTRSSNDATDKSMIVEVSTTTQGGAYTTVATYIDGNTTSGGTSNLTVDLSAYSSNSTVYVRFRKAGTTTSFWYLDNINVFCGAPCTPATITAAPTSGPVGTEVTITATTGSLTGATVSFSGINATIVSNNGTQMVVIVPSGATTGNIKVTDAQPCDATTAFTVISKDNFLCEGTPSTTDLIIYELHDEKLGDGGYITLYNGTASTVDLANYSIYRAGDYGGAMGDYAILTGTIASGDIGVVTVDNDSCINETNGDINAGFNANDQIQLRNAAGTVVIDDVHAYATGPGYYMVRNAGSLSARTTYVAADWSTTPLGDDECHPSAGVTPPSGGATPVVTTHPTYSPSCGSTSAVLSTAGTQGFVGGNPLAYQWYFAAPGSTTWTAVTNGGIYSGATSASLNISVITGVINYQYYCQIRENTAFCYSATNAVKITDTSASTWNGTTWIGGTPTITKAAIIDGTYVTATNGNFSCCSLTVNGTRTLTISSNGYVEVQNSVANNGTFTIEDNGSLVQINNAGVNTGNITYQRIASVRLQDYVYWSAPVTGQTLSTRFSGTPTSYMFRWAPTTTNLNGGQGTWVNYSGPMVAGEGYIVRAATGTSSSTPTDLTTSFAGVPHNGIFTPAIARGTDFTTAGTQGMMRYATDDNWNLLGNPYPSALDIVSTGGFLDANPQLEGFVKIWTHTQLPTSTVDPFYQDFASNYYVNDYNTYNRTGLSTGPGDYKVGSGQGFMVMMDDPGAATTSTATFNNSMRSRTFVNNQFYRTANTTNVDERNRIWVDLVSPTETTRTLVGYVDGATQELDDMFDAFTDYKPAQNFYSIINDKPYIIQGRSLPFDVNDRVPMGIKIPTNGTYTIAIATADGLFTDRTQKIYIEDKLLNTINDLTDSPYQFTATQGVTNDRFVLRYTDQALSNADFVLVENGVSVFGSNNEIKINSTLENIKDYTVYNVLGQTLATKNNVNTNQSAVSSIMRNNQALVVKVVLENGQTVIKKLIF